MQSSVSSSLTALLLCASSALAQSVAPAPDQVVLTNGDVLTGEILSETNDAVTIDHPVLGTVIIQRERISSVRLAPAPGTTVIEAVEAAEAQEAAEAEAAEASADEAAEEKTGEWKSHLELAASLTDGNTENANFRVGITSVREDETDRTNLDTSFFWASTDGDETENRFTAGVLQDWFVPDSRWLYFGDLRYDFDEFQSWDHRANGHLGVGYQLIDKSDLELTLRAGLGAVKEWGSEDDSIRPEALLGADLLWTIDDRQSLEASTRLFPDLGDLGEFRNVNRLGWSYKLATDSNLALAAGLEHEYQSMVDEGVEKNDLRIYAGVQLDF